MTCNVCISDYNKSTHMLVRCCVCGYECCRECIQTYLITDNSNKCMNCKVEWSIEYLNEILPKVWLKNKLLPARVKLILEKEKVKLPGTQATAEILKNQPDIDIYINNLLYERTLLSQKIQTIDNCIQQNRTKIFNAKLAYDGQKLIETQSNKKEFIKKCPNGECKGYLSTRWHCGLCGVDVCNKCHMLKTIEHICDKDEIATIELLKNDSVHCPKRECNVLIHIYEGCDQAWCVKCHTAFNWKTGKIDHGRIHNPEYFRYMRENGGMPREEERCDWGNLITYAPLNNALKKVKVKYFDDNKEYEWISLNKNIQECFRIMNHIYFYERTKFMENNNKELKQQSLRIKFLLSEINEEEWLKKLITLEKISKRKMDYFDLLEMFSQCSSDLLKHQIDNLNFNIEPFIKLNEYFNTQMINLSKTYGTNTILLNNL